MDLQEAPSEIIAAICSQMGTQELVRTIQSSRKMEQICLSEYKSRILQEYKQFGGAFDELFYTAEPIGYKARKLLYANYKDIEQLPGQSETSHMKRLTTIEEPKLMKKLLSDLDTRETVLVHRYMQFVWGQRKEFDSHL